MVEHNKNRANKSNPPTVVICHMGILVHNNLTEANIYCLPTKHLYCVQLLHDFLLHPHEAMANEDACPPEECSIIQITANPSYSTFKMIAFVPFQNCFLYICISLN